MSLMIYYHDWRNNISEMIEGTHYVHAIIGECHGILLSKRGIGDTDKHVTLTWMTEDDGTWHVGTASSTSSYWFSDLQDVLERAEVWMEANCDPDPSGFGYIFR